MCEQMLILFIHLLICLSVVGVGLAAQLVDVDVQILIYAVSVSLAALCLWIAWSWLRLRRSSFDPYILFIMAVSLFNGGRALLEAIGLSGAVTTLAGVSAGTTLKALYLVLLGLSFLHLGALAGAARHPVATRPWLARLSWDASSLAALRKVGWLFLAVSLVPGFYVIRANLITAFSLGYAGLFGREARTSFDAIPQVLFSCCVPGALFLLAGSSRSRFSLLVSASVVGLFSASHLVIGARAAGAMALLAFAWLYDWVFGPVRRRVWLVLGLGLLALFPVIAAMRNMLGADRTSVAKLAESSATIGNPLVSAISEMGSSLTTVAKTLDLVPAVRNFDYGQSYAFAFLTVVPNVGWAVHPTNAHGLLADWFVRTVDPGVAARGGGFGYSCIAEAYLNFGWGGAPLALAGLGFLICRLFVWAESGAHPARLAAVASFLSFFLMFARGESGTAFRPLVWYALLPYLLTITLAPPRGRSRRQPVSASQDKSTLSNRAPGNSLGHES
jgi:oligosaccharide repeat unit polymerase